MNKIEAVATMVVQAKKIVIFTGAGFSTESGVPDFRSPGGVWDTFDPSELNYQNFMGREDIREEYWRMHRMFWETISTSEPNIGHFAVTELHTMGKLDCVVTQNTDGFHQKAGVPDEKVFELHGTMQWVDCIDCGQRYPRGLAHEKMLAGTLVPRCDKCNGVLKPATVAFGQSMPLREMQESEARSSTCDLLIGAGSSMVVYPAASMPVIAKRNGAKLVLINLTATPHDSMSDIVINEKTGETMSAIMALVKQKLQA